MKEHLQQVITNALVQLQSNQLLDPGLTPDIKIDRTRDRSHGDFACNVAMILAKQARTNPRQLAQQVVEAIEKSPQIEKVEVAGPGFINFFLSPSAYHQLIAQILQQGKTFGRSTIGKGKPVQVEFVSANPTGPLHVGHGRGAAYGAAVADLLEAIGFKVHREYYVNDAGRQMDILAVSVWLRYLDLCGEQITFPANAYKGDYIWDIAAGIHRQQGDAFRFSKEELKLGLPADEPEGGDKEAYIDAVIEKAKLLLGKAHYRQVFDSGLNTILDDIRSDLLEFGIEYEDWFSERTLVDSGAVETVINRLRQGGHLYQKGGATWFRTTDLGDEKDRVVIRDNGQKTYFASDIAYHANKLERGYERVIDVWGADHHGYVPRVKAALHALGDDQERLDVLLVQFANLYRAGEKVQMSTRSGDFVTLRELRHEVGNDAARFFYVMRKCEQHLDFDLDLAKSRSSENPVYYIQYAHARVCRVLEQLDQKGFVRDIGQGNENLYRLSESHEQELMINLSRYSEVLESAALSEEPHQLAHYLRQLANDFHTYYNAHTFLVEDEHALRDARLNLIQATRQVIANGLGLLGVSAPETM